MQEQSNETWATIPGTEGMYEASDLGRIRSVPSPITSVGRQRGRVLTPKANRKGYLHLRVCLGGGRNRSVTVHSLIALTFIGPRGPGMEVNHKDGDKKNNRPGNLEYATGLENIRHSWASGLHANDDRKGEAHNMAKLTEESVRTIRAIYPSKSLTELAVMFGVTKQAISCVVKRKTWLHV